jgi:hypothetical protein
MDIIIRKSLQNDTGKTSEDRELLGNIKVVH